MTNRLKNLPKVQALIEEVRKLATYGPPELATLIDLKRLTEQLQELQDPVASQNSNDSSPSPADLDRFRQWFEENGGKFDGVSVATDLAEGTGLVVTADSVAKDQLAVSVPRSLILSAKRAKKAVTGISPFLNTDKHVSEVPHLVLALFLLHERCQLRSFWHPYINVLPRQFPTIPFQWRASDLVGLSASPVLQELIRVFKSYCMQYAYVYQQFFTDNKPPIALPLFTFSSFLWAMCVVASRKNRIPLSAKTPTVLTECLIPGWDFGNHWSGQLQYDSKQAAAAAAAAANTDAASSSPYSQALAMEKERAALNTFMNFETKSCECHSLFDLKAGDQFYIYYGNRPRAQLLLYMGFVPSLQLALVRSIDFLACSFLLVEQIPHYQQKKELLQRAGLADRATENWALFPSGQVDPDLLRFLSLLVLDADEIPPATSTEIPHTLKIEHRALALLCQSCEELLREYASPPLHDMAGSMDQLLAAEKARRLPAAATYDSAQAQSLIRDLIQGEQEILNNTLTVCRRRQSAIMKKIKKNDKKKQAAKAKKMEATTAGQ